MDTQFLNQTEGKIAYQVSGSGPLVIGVPGMGDLRAEYRFLSPQLLAHGYRVAAMDIRGHGESSTQWTDVSVTGTGQDIIALIRSLDAGPAIIIGESISAGGAVWAAAEAPELVRGLILIGPGVRGEFGLPMRVLLGALFARPWGPYAWRKYFTTLFPTRKPTDFAEYSAAIQKNLSEPDRLEALHRMMLSSRAVLEARWERIAAPTLVLMGTKDPDFKDPEAEARWVAGQLKGTFKMIEGAGHYPHVEMPEIAGPLILDFLKTLQLEPSYAAVS